MKQLFIDLTAKLDENVNLKWVDEDKGQMNFERPPVLFPAALVDITIPKTVDLNRKIQNHEAMITVRLAFDFSGNTSTTTPEAERMKSLAFYDVVEQVKKALQGWSGQSFNSLSLKGFHQEKRPDGYKVVALTFATSYQDNNS